jgi:hypothetical protein
MDCFIVEIFLSINLSSLIDDLWALSNIVLVDIWFAEKARTESEIINTRALKMKILFPKDIFLNIFLIYLMVILPVKHFSSFYLKQQFYILMPLQFRH